MTDVRMVWEFLHRSMHATPTHPPPHPHTPAVVACAQAPRRVTGACLGACLGLALQLAPLCLAPLPRVQWMADQSGISGTAITYSAGYTYITFTTTITGLSTHNCMTALLCGLLLVLGPCGCTWVR